MWRVSKRGAAAAARIMALAMLLAPTGVHAAKTTVNDITLDVPAGYKVSSSKRGVLVKTPDGEVDVWVETFLGAESDGVMAEHTNYWKKQDVVLGQANDSDGKSGGAEAHNTDFPKATWKGDPTVVRYSILGPFGSQNEMLLVTYWASPKGDKQYGDDIQKIIGDINFKYPK